MTIAYFDCQFGAAGDMLVSALLSAGLPESRWRAALDGIDLPAGSFEVSIDDAVRGSIAARHLTVRQSPQQEERRLSEIAGIIGRSKIAAGAKKLALSIFTRLAEAEAAVHGVPAAAVHFHEVGAVDAIVDIVGFAIGYEMLEIEASFGSALPVGSGVVQTEHGLFPVPGPAVLNLLASAGVPVRSSEIDYECLTPTGAAILTTVVRSWGSPPALRRVNGIGYGAGTRDPAGWPNVVRVVLGEPSCDHGQSPRFESERAVVVEANLDDFSPQALAYAVERLWSAGALDVTVQPAVMKKGRAGQILSVICKPGDVLRIQELILSETSTIGTRSYEVGRLIADRRWQEVTLSRGGRVRIKVALDRQGNVVNAAPEFDDCAAYASEHQLPVKEVIAEAVARFRDGSASGTSGKLNGCPES